MNARYHNVSEVPLSLAVFLASDYYDYSTVPNEISATTLLKPLKQILLPRRLPPGEGTINLSNMINIRLGSAIHDAIERAWITNHKNALQALGWSQSRIDRVLINPKPEELIEGVIPVYLEQRLKRSFKNWVIVGKFDFVAQGIVEDFKSTSTYTYKKQLNAQKYIQQGSIYRWLDSKLITGDILNVNYIFTDWKSGLAKFDNTYPQKPFHTQSFPLMSLAQTEAFIANKLTLIEQYQDSDEIDMPICTDEELWRTSATYKYYKNPEKIFKSTKNFETQSEAYTYMSTNGNQGIVKKVPGQVMACKYCPAFSICSQKNMYIANGDLVI